MTPFQAHALFCARPDGGHSLLVPEMDRDMAPVFAAALAALSGQLDDAQTQDDLDEATRHGFTLLRIGTVGQEDLHREIEAILDEVKRFAESGESN